MQPSQHPVLHVTPNSENLVYFLSMRFSLEQTSRKTATDMIEPKMLRSNSRKLESACVWDEFSNPAWNVLFRRFGAVVFTYLFDECHLFRILPNFNFLQLAGSNLMAQARTVPPFSRMAQSASTSTVTRLQQLRSRAEAQQENHEIRLEAWKKKQQFSERFALKTANHPPFDEEIASEMDHQGQHELLGPPDPKRPSLPHLTETASSSSIVEFNTSSSSTKAKSSDSKISIHSAFRSFGQSKYQLSFAILPRYSMLYKHSSRLLYGLPISWEPKMVLADANGASKVLIWIFGHFSGDVSHLEPLIIGFIQRVSKIKFRVILEASCPLLPSDADSPMEKGKTEFSSPPHFLASQIPYSRPKVSGGAFISAFTSHNPSSADQGPTLDQHRFHSEPPILMSSGIRNDERHISTSYRAKEVMDSNSKSILTQIGDANSQSQIFDTGSAPMLKMRTNSGEMFDIENEEDYLLTLLMEPERDLFEGWNLQKLVSHSCPPHQVASFLNRVVSQLISRPLLGSDYNWKLLEAKIKHFVRLNRFDSISSKQLLEGFKVTDISWAYGNKKTQNVEAPRRSAGETQKATVLFHKFLVWLFEHLIMVLIRSNFYVTENMAHRNQLFYYRNEVWRSIKKHGIDSLVSRGLLVPISNLSAKEILKNRELGTCSLRFVPKPNGLRPIVNLKKNFSNPEKKDFATSINELLAPVHAVITHETSKNPMRILASSCMRHDEVHARLSHFRKMLRLLSNGSSSSTIQDSDHLPTLYFVKLDIISAFDEIQQNKLMDILSQDVLTLERYVSTLSSKLRVNRGRWTQSGIKTFLGPNERAEMDDLLGQHLSKFSNSILAITTTSEFATRDKLLGLLGEHITKHLVLIEGQYYLQRRGIPQGSILSSLLCSIYFGCLEKTYLKEYLEPSIDQSTGKAKDASILLRWIDDFLFITTNKKKAVRFFERMHAGFDDFGTRCNPAKSCVNFPLQFQGESVTNISLNASMMQSTQVPGEMGEENEEVWAGANEMIWCGWSFDTRSFEIRKSIPSRMILPEMITTVLSSRPGHSMSEKCHASVSNAIHLLLFDGTFNTRQTILENVFDILAWNHLRMISIERSMHFTNSLPNGAESRLPPLPNPKFIVDLLFSLAQRFISVLWKRIKSPKTAHISFCSKIAPKDISAISLYSARFILNVHAPQRFSTVIESLNAMIKTSESDQQSAEQSAEYKRAMSNRSPLFKAAIV